MSEFFISSVNPLTIGAFQTLTCLSPALRSFWWRYSCGCARLPARSERRWRAWTGCECPWLILSWVTTNSSILRGNSIIIAGTTLALVALTWGGIRFAWDDAHVLAPLILGFILIAAFFLYEAFVPSEPTLPLDVMRNRSSLGG